MELLRSTKYITLEGAKQMMAAAEAESARRAAVRDAPAVRG